VPVLLFTLGISVLSGVMFGAVPALRATQLGPLADLKDGAGASRAFVFRSGKLLIIAETALCLTIVTGAGLLVRTLDKLENVNLGFNRDHLVLFSVRPGLNGYKDERLVQYYQELQQRVEALPGILAAGFSSRPPIGAGTGSSSAIIDGITPPDRPVPFLRHQVGPDYFRALGVPVVAGRAIGAQDTRNATPVVLINEKLAAVYFHGDNPLGHTMNFGTPAKRMEYTIVGVVKDVKYSQIRREAPPTVYFSYPQFLSIPVAMTYELRTTFNAASVVDAIRREAFTLDRNVPLVDVRSQAEVIDQAVFLERTIAALTAWFAALALLLACVGLYGTTSYAVSQRTREIGIRMALGADHRQIRLTVMREVLLLLFSGVAIGLPLTLTMTRFLKGQLFDLAPYDPLTTVTAIAVISVVIALAGYLPARKASSIAPVIALRVE
jgi:predicted permease